MAERRQCRCTRLEPLDEVVKLQCGGTAAVRSCLHSALQEARSRWIAGPARFKRVAACFVVSLFKRHGHRSAAAGRQSSLEKIDCCRSVRSRPDATGRFDTRDTASAELAHTVARSSRALAFVGACAAAARVFWLVCLEPDASRGGGAQGCKHTAAE